MDRVKWLLVGAGDISHKRVAPTLAEAQDSGIVAICDVRKEQAQSLADKFGVKEVFTDFTEALTSSSADAVYLATPVWLHAEQAVKVLEAGKHVLIEKPLGQNSTECETVIAVAEKTGKNVACAYFRRFYPRYIHAKEMLKKGEFGQVVSVRMTFFSWFNPTPDDPKYWRVVKAKSGGGPLSDMGTHMFDVLIGLFGMPVSVYAKCDNLVHRWDVEDTANVLMALQNGARVLAFFSWNSKTWRHEFEIVGVEAKVNWLPYDSGPVIKTVGRNVGSLDLPCAENVHMPLVEDFVQSVLSGRSPLYSITESAKTNVLLDAVYRSVAENREVEVG